MGQDRGSQLNDSQVILQAAFIPRGKSQGTQKGKSNDERCVYLQDQTHMDRRLEKIKGRKNIQGWYS